jgi:chemotaxis protein CheX
MSTLDLGIFSAALKEVFCEVGIDPIKVTPRDTAEKTSHEVVSSLGITGDLHGYLILKIDYSSGMNFVKCISEFMGMEVEETEFGKYHRAAIAEITNQISGRATMLLSKAGFDCMITPPTIITGSDIYTDLLHFDDYYRAEIAGNFGKIDLSVGLKKSVSHI